MTKKELSRLYWLNREIRDERERLTALEAAATSATSKISGLPHLGALSDKTGLAAEIADCRDIIDAKLRQSVAEYNRLCRYIAAIDDPLMRQIIRLRYVDGRTWQQIAFAIGEHDEQYPRRKHNAFLKVDENDD